MRLDELFQTTLKNRHVAGHDYKALEVERAQRLSDLASGKTGSGAYGKVTDHKSDNHMVKKSNYLPVVNLEKEDGYFAYIKAVVDGKLAQKNPYFPRIYDIKTFTDDYGEQRYRITLEKLLHLDEVSEGELIAVLSRAFKNFEDVLEQNKGNFERAIDQCIDRRQFANSLIFEAFEVIDKVIATNKSFSFDVTTSNIMLRRIINGLQLVIIDPIS